MLLAGIVILYNPDDEVLDNIATYIEELDWLYVFDNTEAPDPGIVGKIKEFPHVQYISFGENKGISYALNIALKSATDYRFLLTMDQDSRFYEGMLSQYKKFLENNYSKDNTVAMFSVHYDGLPESRNADDVETVDRAITSGSVLNVEIANRIGGFDENLFIDEVDNEFCYRARLNGYKILQLNKIKLQHHLGNPIPIKLFGRNYAALNHGAVRKYYISRNNIYIMKKYPKVRLYCMTELIKLFIKTLWTEPDKWKRTQYMIKGIRDGVEGNMGKLD